MKKLLLILSISVLSKIVFGQIDNVKILKDADLHRAGQLENVSWKLKVLNFKQNKLENEIAINVDAKTTAKDQLVLVSFLAPKKFEGQRLLIRNNNMWFTKKGLDRPIAISGRQRLSGSASNADVANANYSIDYKIVNVQETKLEGISCYLFDLEANNNFVSYFKIKYWINKVDHTALKAEYYGKTDKLIKVATFEYSTVSMGGVPTKMVSKTIIKDNINMNDFTTLESTDFEFKAISFSKFEK
ncbi:hypothetical protein QE382_004367 [Sphingobacterium zeae]|uniref:Uncharacterized protein TP-0789 domain-containing protein n=1 Tax=Sphingobacterium zeae TaxID=1776859 RepID=A0ABU0UC02_9SPHI|nr:outer membrane lipoprotein-sorting protein [Sphingobacterium zeae]MDQ1152383.1 hypothetical protein [Sphingobacterium zeae]